MTQAVPRPRFSLADYLAIEPEGKVRHEFIDGELVAMTGTSRTHNLIVTNLTIALGMHCRGTPCRVTSHDMKVVIASADRGFYPDLVVSCSDPDTEIDDYTETQPLLIVEVLSPSTEAFDRGDKRQAYQQLDSLQDYVLVAQDKALVEIYHRESADSDSWNRTEYRAGATLALTSIDLHLPVARVYEGIALASDANAE